VQEIRVRGQADALRHVTGNGVLLARLPKIRPQVPQEGVRQDAISLTTVPAPRKGLDSPIARPFTRLDKGIYLRDQPEGDVYRILIDARLPPAHERQKEKGKKKEAWLESNQLLRVPDNDI